MTVTKRNIMVPVDQIEPHPDNPRKDVGDVTELAESIKKNGIFQNLTILRTPNENGKSTVIIGHRRLAAANNLVLSDTEYEMLGLRERAEELRTKGIKQMLERCGHGR